VSDWKEVSGVNVADVDKNQDSYDAFHNLYKNQGKLVKAKKMYQRALEEYERLRGSTHSSTKVIRHNLSNFSI